MIRLLFISISVIIALNTSAQTVYKQDEGETFPLRSFTTIDGEKIDSVSLKGKVVFYNFYFDACSACRVEMKGLSQLYDKYKDSETVFIAITFDDADKAHKTREQYGLKFKIISLQGKEIAELTNKTNYPTNIIVDKKGKIAFKESGTVIPEYWTTKHVLETFGPIIEKELKN